MLLGSRRRCQRGGRLVHGGGMLVESPMGAVYRTLMPTMELLLVRAARALLSDAFMS
jgi:hypothetical protein